MIGVDWGTTSLRAYRLAPDGAVLERRESAGGILAVPPGGFPEALRASVGDWIAQGERRVLLAGMVGSRQGWVEAPYLPCPAGIAEIAAAAMAIPFDGADVRLVPGLTCRDTSGVPEAMRGEETQLLGLHGLAGAGEATACLPGSHAKWVRLSAGRIQDFTTHLTGEAFAALSGHTILARMLDPTGPHHAGGFARGVARAKQPGGLLHHLFGLRAAGLFDEITQAEAASFLSGLLIGHEVAAALEAGVAPPVILVGSAVLTARYGAALDGFGIPHRAADPDAAARGLHRIAGHLP